MRPSAEDAGRRGRRSEHGDARRDARRGGLAAVTAGPSVGTTVADDVAEDVLGRSVSFPVRGSSTRSVSPRLRRSMSLSPRGQDQPAVGDARASPMSRRGRGRRFNPVGCARLQTSRPVVTSMARQHALLGLAQEEVADDPEPPRLRRCPGRRPCRWRAAGPRSDRLRSRRSRRSRATASGPRWSAWAIGGEPSHGGLPSTGAFQRTVPSAIDRTSAVQRSPSQRVRGDEVGARDGREHEVARGRRVPALLAGLQVDPAQARRR